MVKTQYPAMWKTFGKAHILALTMFMFIPFNYTLYVGVLNWKRGRLPRLCHNDNKNIGYNNDRGYREKFIWGPALDFYPD